MREIEPLGEKYSGSVKFLPGKTYFLKSFVVYKKFLSAFLLNSINFTHFVGHSSGGKILASQWKHLKPILAPPEIESENLAHRVENTIHSQLKDEIQQENLQTILKYAAKCCCSSA